MDKLNLDQNNLRKFGFTMSGAIVIITLIILWKRHYLNLPFPVIAGCFVVAALAYPAMLKPVYIIWMRLVFVLAWISTRLFLLVVFYLVFTPMALVIRLLGKDLLSIRIDKNKNSYWHKKENKAFSRSDYERQF